MSAYRRALFLVGIVEGQSMRRGGSFEVLAAYLQWGSVHRDGNIEARNGHRLARQCGHHGAGDDSHLLVAGIHQIAHIRGRLTVHQQTEDLEALLSPEAGMGVRAVEVVLCGTDREVEAEFPKTVAGRVLVEGI